MTYLRSTPHPSNALFLRSKVLMYSILILMVSACSTPQQLYEKGKYDKAFDAALSEVQEKKSRKSKVLLNKAFAKWIDEVRGQVLPLESGYDIHSLEHNLELYESVADRYDRGSSFLDGDNLLKYDALAQDRDQEVDAAYHEGLALMQDYEVSGRKLNAQAAHYHFVLVDQYAAVDYPELDELTATALDAGTVIYNVRADLIYDHRYRWDVDRTFDDMEGREGYVLVVYDESLSVGDCSVTLAFSRLDEDYQTSVSNQSFSREIEDGYTTHVDTSGNTIKTPKYITVNGNVETTRTSKILTWRVDLDIRDRTGHCDLREDRFVEQVVDQIDAYRTSGDDRAIPSQYFQNNRQQFADTDDMVDDLIDDLYREIRRYIYR